MKTNKLFEIRTALAPVAAAGMSILLAGCAGLQTSTVTPAAAHGLAFKGTATAVSSR